MKSVSLTLRVWTSRVAFITAIWLMAGAATAGSAPDDDFAFLGALTWGANSSSFADLRAKGREHWLREQLHPTLGAEHLPVSAEVVAGPLVRSGSLLERVLDFEARDKAAKAEPEGEARKKAQQARQSALFAEGRDAAALTLMRALYGQDQIRQRLTWFWFNRFNIYQGKANLRLFIGDYIDNAIRPNALGRFRDILMATLRHPAMLRYLDNIDNASGHINENYAREIMELHTMGVGSGYTQADVEALARILTGVGFSTRVENPKITPARQHDLIREGMFLFNPARHDYSDKILLGHLIRGRGFSEVEEAVDLLSRHPATSRNVSRAIATYFTSSAPSDAFVERLATVFMRSDGNIAALTEAMVNDPEFLTALLKQPKDPMRYVLSAIRLAYNDRVVLNTGPIRNWLSRLGMGLFNRSTPDGYPLNSESWTGPGQMAARFEVARQIGSGPSGMFKPPRQDAVEEPAFPLLLNDLYFLVLSRRLSSDTRSALDRAVSAQDWNILYLSSPEFMH